MQEIAAALTEPQAELARVRGGHRIIVSLPIQQKYVQEIAAALTQPQAELVRVRGGYEALVAHFGDNPAAAPPDSEFWEGTICPFVRAVDEQQRAQLRSQQASSTHSTRSRQHLEFWIAHQPSNIPGRISDNTRVKGFRVKG